MNDAKTYQLDNYMNHTKQSTDF